MTLGKLSVGSLKLKPDKIAVKHDAEAITEESREELSAQAKQIHAQEARLAERMDFDNDRTYYFSVLFKSTEERDAFLAAKHIKLHDGDYVFFEDIKDLLK